jgi:hypothetical protein
LNLRLFDVTVSDLDVPHVRWKSSPRLAGTNADYADAEETLTHSVIPILVKNCSMNSMSPPRVRP